MHFGAAAGIQIAMERGVSDDLRDGRDLRDRRGDDERDRRGLARLALVPLATPVPPVIIQNEIAAANEITSRKEFGT